MAFVKAKREKVWLKISLGGTSGSGKSYSALRLASGIKKKQKSDIAFISTEKSRTKYYADKFDYDVLELTDYSPESYINAIDEAVSSDYSIIIIDSMSHGWQWLNDTHSKMPGNSFQNWGKLKPRYQKLMQKILSCPAHVITCSRAKTEWAMEDKNGKQVPKKVGLGNEGDKQADFEYTVALMIEQGTHIASIEGGGKDNTGLFEGKYDILTEKDGEALYNWANSGDEPTATIVFPEESEESISDLKKEIIIKCKELGGQESKVVMAAVEKFGNPSKLKDITVAKEFLTALN